MPYTNEQWEYYSNWNNFSKEKDILYSSEQFNFFLDKLKNNNPFSLIRFGEGESRVVISQQNLSRKELTYNPILEKNTKYRNDLIESAKINLSNYYIGIQSYTYKPGEPNRPLNEFTEQRRIVYELGNFNYSRYTCSRIFCNFPDRCINELLPVLNQYECYFVGNSTAKTNLFLNLKHKWNIAAKDAWKHNFNLYDTICEQVKTINNSVFVITGGFFANILISKLAQINSNNFYLNVGSVYDPLLYGITTRGYHKNYQIYNNRK